MRAEFYADLFKQTRDDEDAVTLVFKTSATEFAKVIGIPTRTLLKITVEPVQPNANP